MPLMPGVGQLTVSPVCSCVNCLPEEQAHLQWAAPVNCALTLKALESGADNVIHFRRVCFVFNFFLYYLCHSTFLDDIEREPRASCCNAVSTAELCDPAFFPCSWRLMSLGLS